MPESEPASASATWTIETGQEHAAARLVVRRSHSRFRMGGCIALALTPARQVEFLPRAGHLAVPAPPWARLGTLAVDSPAARLSTHMAGSRPPPDGVEPRGRVSQWPRSRGFIFVREGGDSLLCAMVGGLSAVRSPTTPSRRNMKRACTFEGAMGRVGSSCPALPWDSPMPSG